MSIDRLSATLTDRYRIERELGQGGMATVYLAHDLRHDRKVAIKVLRPELAAVLGADRFVVEIRTTAQRSSLVAPSIRHCVLDPATDRSSTQPQRSLPGSRRSGSPNIQ